MDNQLAIKCMNGECEDINQVILARATAVKSLEKQIPMSPEYDKGTNTLNCPVCGNYLQHFVDRDSLNGSIPRYCKNCGQKINAVLLTE